MNPNHDNYSIHFFPFEYNPKDIINIKNLFICEVVYAYMSSMSTRLKYEEVSASC